MSVVPDSFDHDDCCALQLALNEKCHAFLIVDGDLGPKTVAQLQTFQAQSALPVTGVFDDATSAVLLPFMRQKYLSHSDYTDAASQLSCELAAVYAAVRVEAGGDGFLPDGRCDILFERHRFYAAVEQKYGTSKAKEMQSTHPTICNPLAGGYLGGAREWDRMAVAEGIDAMCAHASASWGMFQVMGSNYKLSGWDSLQQFVADMMSSERQQLRAFVGFIKSQAGLLRALQQRDWATYARLYNGANYVVNHYDTRMAVAYASYKNAA